MKQVQLRIRSNAEIADNVFRMEMEGDVSAITTPGQFINIRVEGGFLRRPISVCDVDTVVTGTKRIEKEAAEAFGTSLYNTPQMWDSVVKEKAGTCQENVVEGTVTILYKTVGAGTKALAGRGQGEVLDVLTGLGNGFDIRKAGDAPLLVGGGIGSAPMLMLAKQLINDGVRPTVVLGFRSVSDMILQGDLYEIGCDVYVATEDGSSGMKGFVTDQIRALREQGMEFSQFFACGPSPMLKAVYRDTQGLEGQLSFEERMGCGFGACMGCSMETKNGPKRVCKDGPVFMKSELLWD
ncbi:MAG: dihydroorotate dehydrogenase electron transfer subunit [Lachnospiraceae bacterium]|nr:dihydroorotate dehydrogenase electron transfer subunit [Lachnospiraceae bacterium]